MRRNLLYAVAGMAGLMALTGQVVTWRGVSVNQGGVANVSGITFSGAVTGGQFVGDGSKLTGISGGTNWYSTLTSTGRTMIGWLQGPVLASNCTFTVIGSPWHFLNQVQFYGESSWLRATNALNRIGGDGRWLYNLPGETNWWAVITIEDPEALKAEGYPRWSDITLKCWTNGPTHFGGHNPVFCYTTTDPALNGTPSWESFTTNWYPRVFYCQSHAGWDITWLAEWKHISPTHPDSIYDTIGYWDSAESASFPFRWVVMVRDTGAWFHPTNNLSWAYTLQDNTSHPTVKARDGSTVLTQAPWYKAVPMWVNYDPRPKIAREFWAGGAGTLSVTNQHQRP